MPSSIASDILIHAVIWPQQTLVENWGLCPFGEGELGPHLTQCIEGRSLPACQVSSSSVQPFGHNIPTLQTDRTDRSGQTDRQRSDRIGRTALQTVVQQQSCYNNFKNIRTKSDYRKYFHTRMCTIHVTIVTINKDCLCCLD